jgi:hypothetical protein
MNDQKTDKNANGLLRSLILHLGSELFIMLLLIVFGAIIYGVLALAGLAS